MPARDIEVRRETSRRFYTRHKERVKGKVIARKQEVAEWFSAFKATLSCSVCGENHPGCLDFHHRDSKQKEIGISYAVMNGWGREKILEEIGKCDILCANCHRKVHYDTRGMHIKGG